MDTLENYRELCESILTEYTRVPYAYGDIEIQKVFDRIADHYMVMLVGREGKKRVGRRGKCGHNCRLPCDAIASRALYE